MRTVMRERTTQLSLLVLAASGIAIAAFGQAQTTRPLSDRLKWLAPYADKVTDVYPEPKPVIAGMVLLAVGVAIFVAASWGWVDRKAEGATLDSPGRGFGLRIREDGLPILAGLLGVIPLLVVVLRLYDNEYSHYLIPVFLVTLALAAVPFAARDLRPMPRPRLRWSWWFAAEALFVAAMMAMFISLNLIDLTNWRFAAEGDEYAFYYAAKNIADGDPFNIFSQEGVYGYHPWMSTAYQALFVKFLGGDIFAWKLSMVAIVALTLVPFYLLMRELFSWRAAMFATAFVAASHYLFAFAHTGFISLNALFPTVLALWLLVAGLRRDSSLALFGSGAVAGLGFYTLFSARATILIIGLFLLTQGLRGLRPEKLLPIALAFALVVTPIFTLHGWDVVDAVIKQSAAEAPEASGARVERFAHNIVPSVMAFSYNPLAARYVSGSLLDPVSAVLFALGLGLAAGKVRHPGFRLLLIWWAVALGVTGLANPRAEVAITRMHYVLPAAAALAGVALERALFPLLDVWRRPAIRAAVAVGALSLLMVPVLYLNLHRFWYETPRVDGTTYIAVVTRAVTSDDCEAQPQPAAIVTPYPEGLLVAVYDAYNLGDRSPLLLPYASVLEPDGALTAGDWKGCIVVDADTDPALVSQVVTRLQQLYPEKARYTLRDGTGSFETPVFR